MVKSPCINVCVINQDNGLCEGCGRSLQEIAQWGSFSPQQRRKIMDELKARKQPVKTSE